MDVLNKLPTNAAIQAALSTKKLDNADSLPEMRSLLKKYSKTQGDLKFLRAVHIAGSKGKGSVCAFTEQIFRFKGLKTGMFTSPHLVHPRERIRINGKAVSEDLFAKHVLRLDQDLKSHGVQVSFFRFLWIIAVDIFREAEVDVGIIEVGMGGRFDATNVLDEPTVCGITSLAMEHVNILGPSVNEIAWHKSGIIKPNAPIYSVNQITYPETEIVIKQEAESYDAPLVFVSKDSFIDDSWVLGIDGTHQKENAALSCALVSKWLQTWHPSEFLSKEELKSALHSTKWPGRQHKHNVSSKLALFLDGSHTFESICATAKWFKDSVDGLNHKEENVKNVLYFHCSPDRDHVKLLQPLLNIEHLFNDVFFLIPSSLYATDLERIKHHHQEMAEFWSMHSPTSFNASVVSEIVPVSNQPTNTLVCGSLYLVGHFMSAFCIDP